jgi:uncharacterized protein YdeI (YjbR/CyaY-like superfamily)
VISGATDKASAGCSLLTCKNRAEWRAWLAANHRKAGEVWLAHYKRASGKPTVSYEEAVEEALCFGWIDGKKRSIDAERYAYRYTPRNPKSAWSALNITRAKALNAAGKMHPAGLKAFEGHQKRKTPPHPTSLPENLQELFEKNKTAWTHFNEFSPGYKKLCIAWVASAKREETQLRRLNALMACSSKNRKMNLM